MRDGHLVGLQVMKDHIEVPLALIEAELGRFDSACERLDRMNRRRAELQMQGVTLGWGYEARACSRAGDGRCPRLQCQRAELCAQQYGAEPRATRRWPAKYERLMQDTQPQMYLGAGRDSSTRSPRRGGHPHDGSHRAHVAARTTPSSRASPRGVATIPARQQRVRIESHAPGRRAPGDSGEQPLEAALPGTRRAPRMRRR